MRLRCLVVAMTVAAASSLLTGAGRLEAQVNLSSFRGRVLDEQRLAIAGASLQLEELNGGAKRTARAGNDGTFEIPALQPGDYRLTVEAAAFQTKQLRLRVAV